MKNNNFLITVIILTVVALIAVPFYYYVPNSKEEASVSNIPLELGDWKGKDLEIEERVFEILETRNLIMREYESKQGEKVYLYIVYSQDNRKVSHPPELCMEGEGLTVKSKEVIPFVLSQNITIKANKFIIEGSKVRNLVVYWYKAGSAYMTDYLKQQLKVALDRLSFKRTCGALIRISVVLSEEDDQEKKLQLISNFCKELYPYLDKVIP